MQNNTLTTIENLEVGDLFCKEFGGLVYLVISKQIIRYNKKVFPGKVRRICTTREMLIRNEKSPVIFLSKRQDEKK